MDIEEQLYEAAVELIKQRYPVGWGGAAAMLTADGRILTSVAPEVHNDSVSLCIETGAICEAHKLNVAVTHSICVQREDERSPFVIATPCGVCQERLFYWGEDVRVAISDAEGRVVFKTLREVQPYYWLRPYLQAKT